MSERPKHFATPHYRAFCTAIFTLATVDGLTEPDAPTEPDWPAWITIAASLAAPRV